MKRINKNYSYVEKLQDLNIKVKPLEPYIDNSTKILHLCTCNNKWMVKPQVILRGHKCGCKNNNSYLVKLKAKNIQVMPIENYKGSNIKIKHKCICENIYKIKPNTLLTNGSLCGDCKEYNYTDKLLSKGIKVIPLEPYEGNLTKINHRCTCNNVWEVTPAQALRGGKCMLCKETVDRKFYKNKRTILYSFNIPYTNLYKIGITSTSVKNRYKSVDVILPDNIIEIIYEDGVHAWDREYELKKTHRGLLYMGEELYVGTKNTEVFTEDILSKSLL